MPQIITLYNLHLHNIICQFYLNKAGEKIKIKKDTWRLPERVSQGTAAWPLLSGPQKSTQRHRGPPRFKRKPHGIWGHVLKLPQKAFSSVIWLWNSPQDLSVIVDQSPCRAIPSSKEITVPSKRGMEGAFLQSALSFCFLPYIDISVPMFIATASHLTLNCHRRAL